MSVKSALPPSDRIAGTPVLKARDLRKIDSRVPNLVPTILVRKEAILVCVGYPSQFSLMTQNIIRLIYCILERLSKRMQLSFLIHMVQQIPDFTPYFYTT